VFDDSLFAENFAAVFRSGETPPGRIDRTIDIKGNSTVGYDVCLDTLNNAVAKYAPGSPRASWDRAEILNDLPSIYRKFHRQRIHGRICTT
jgi:hypothetical protein